MANIGTNPKTLQSLQVGNQPQNSVLDSPPKLPTASTALVYGETNTFKTTELAYLAQWVYETTGKKTRYIRADLGGSTHIKKWIDAEIMDELFIHAGFKSIKTLIRALWTGAWKPISTRNGKLVLTPPVIREVKLPGEVQIGAAQTYKVSMLQEPVGMYAIEGISSIATRLLREITREGRKIGEDVVGEFSEESMLPEGAAEKFAAPGRAHYNFVQNFILDMISGFSSLPVDYVVFTAHDGKGEDTTTKTVIYGPAVVGKAATSAIPPMVGDLFHLETVDPKTGISLQPAQKKEDSTVRAYFQKHPDSQISSILWPAKPRFPPTVISSLFQKWPEGYIDLKKNHLWEYFKYRDEIEKSQGDDLRKWKEEIDKIHSSKLEGEK